MKNAIIIHGTTDEEEYYSDEYPSPSNSHWIPWLQKQLLKQGYDCQTPEMPNPLPFKYVYSEWTKIIERYPINNSTYLIGHSTGTGFLLRFLTENMVNIQGLILVAPYLDPFKEESKDFFEFKFDKKLFERIKNKHILYSTDDSKSVLESTRILRNIYPNIDMLEFKDKGHFTYESLKSNQFLELLSLIQNS